jgi:hypothetical protein
MSGQINEKQVLIDNLVTTTWYSVRKEIQDQVFKITPFWDKLMSVGGIKEKAPDGTHFEYPLRYAKQDQNRKWFGRGDTFGKSEKESLTRMYFFTRNVGTNVVRFWDDDRKNKGTAKLLDYAEEMVSNAKGSMLEAFEDDSLVQNADPLAMSALPTLISQTPTTGTLGGLDRSVNPYLQNQYKDFSALTVAANLLDEMTAMYNNCSIYKGNESRTPDIILCDQTTYQYYEKLCRALHMIVANVTSRAGLGFGNLMFKDVELFWAPNVPAGTMYFLNSKTIELPYDPDAWFEMTPWKEIPDSLDRMAQIVCVCNLICHTPRKNGVIFNINTYES